MVEFETEFLRVWIDVDVKLMFSEWLRPVNSREYREANLRLLRFLEEHRVLYWITDTSKLGAISKSDEDWTLPSFAAKLPGTALKKLARISGADKASYPKFEAFTKRAEEAVDIGSVQVRQFMTYKEAADWVGNISA